MRALDAEVIEHGHCVAAEEFSRAISYEDMATGGAVIVFGPDRDMLEAAENFLEFFADESCGQCTPCRIGSTRGVEVIDKIRNGDNRDANLLLLEDLCETMVDGSLCAMGGMTPFPVQSAIKYFPEDFQRKPSMEGSKDKGV